MNRRSFLTGSAALAFTPAVARDALHFDGRGFAAAGRDLVFVDIAAPAIAALGDKPDIGADFAFGALGEILKRGAMIDNPKAVTDRWGRIKGPHRWRLPSGRETTLEEIMLAEGAARVSPSTSDLEFLERCFAAETAARAARTGLWARPAWRILDATKSEWRRGWAIYGGVIQRATERNGRIFFNFGEDYRSDFTATARRGAFRRWNGKPELESFDGAAVEVRGEVLSINGPSIELTHQYQMRRLEKPAGAL